MAITLGLDELRYLSTRISILSRVYLMGIGLYNIASVQSTAVPPLTGGRPSVKVANPDVLYLNFSAKSFSVCVLVLADPDRSSPQ